MVFPTCGLLLYMGCRVLGFAWTPLGIINCRVQDAELRFAAEPLNPKGPIRVHLRVPIRVL